MTLTWSTPYGFRPFSGGHPNFATEPTNGGRISQPVLYVGGGYDQVNTINGNHYGDVVCAACTELTFTNIPTVYWLPLEKKAELVQTIRTCVRINKL